MKPAHYLLLWALSLLTCGWLCWDRGREAGRGENRDPVSDALSKATGAAPKSMPSLPPKGMASVVVQVDGAAELAPDSPEFATAVRKVMRETDSRRRMAAWYALLENLTPAHLAAIVPLIRENDIRGPGSGSEWAMMWEVWAAKDGAGALAFLQQHDWTGWSKLSRPGARYNALIGWGRGDPETAAAWLQQPGNHADDLERALLIGWSNKDPEAAATWGVAHASQGSLEPAFGEMSRRGGVERLEQWVQGQRPENIHLEQAAEALGRAKIRSDPTAAAAWLEQNEDQPWNRGGNRIVGLTKDLAGKDPVAAMMLAQRLKNEHAAGTVMQVWCNADITAASEWLKANPDIPRYDSSVASLVQKLKIEDPEAARAWADTIRDPAKKASAIATLWDPGGNP